MNNAIYYLINLDKDLTHDDFIKITSMLGEMKDVGINIPEDEKDTAYIFYDFAPFRPKIKFVPELKEFDYAGTPMQVVRIELETDITDRLTANLLKDIVGGQDIKIFFTNLDCFLPKDNRLYDCVTLSGEHYEKAKTIIERYKMQPVFFLIGRNIYYAVSDVDKSVHIINDNLLHHQADVDSKDTYPDEFSYKVADNLKDFVRKYDEDLIPTYFYDYFKKSIKIINYSGFDINNPGRKVFIKPYILEYEKDGIDFFKIAWEDSSLLFMDKIRPGETLDASILRILKEELKIANDYIGAVVSREVEFDPDKNNVLTPRLVVRIYIKEAHMTSEQLAKKNRTWVSFNQVKDVSTIR